MKQRNLKRMIAVLLAGIMIVANINVTPVIAGETKTVEEVFFEDDFSNATDKSDLILNERWTAYSDGSATKAQVTISKLADDNTNPVLAFPGTKNAWAAPRLMKAIDVTEHQNFTVEFDVRCSTDECSLEVGVNQDMSSRSVTLTPLFWKGGSAGEWTTCKIDFTIDGSTVTSKAYKKTGNEWVADTTYEDVSYTLTDNTIYLNFYAYQVTNTKVVYLDNVKMYTLREVSNELNCITREILSDDFDELPASSSTANSYLSNKGWTASGNSVGAQYTSNLSADVDGRKVLALSSTNYSCDPRIMKTIDFSSCNNVTVQFEVKTIGRALEVGVDNENETSRRIALEQIFWTSAASTNEWVATKIEFTNGTSGITSTAYILQNDEWVADVNYTNVPVTATDGKINLTFLSNEVDKNYSTYIDNVIMYATYEVENEDEHIFTADFENTSTAADLLSTGWSGHTYGLKNSNLYCSTRDERNVLIFTSNNNYSAYARVMKEIDVTGLENLTVEFDVKLTNDTYKLNVGASADMTTHNVSLNPVFWRGGSSTEWTRCKLEFSIDGNAVTSKAYVKTGDEWVADTAYENTSYTLTDNKIYLNFYAPVNAKTTEVYVDNVDIYTTHSYADGLCVDCEKAQATLKGHSVTLDGSIGVNFCVKMPAAASYYENMKMEFELPSGTQTVAYSDATDVNGYKAFTCSVPAKEMTDSFTATLYDGDTPLSSSTYSVREYADTILADETTYAKEIPLVQEMLNYGSSAQTYFNYNTGKLANDGSHMGSTSLADVSYETLAEYQTQTALGDDNVKLYGASLVLESKTTLRLYFTGEKAATATCNGEELTKKGSYYYVDISNINPQDLDEDYTVTLAYDDTTVDVTYNCMTFGYNVLKSESTSDAWKNLVRALYLYSEAATTYLAE